MVEDERGGRGREVVASIKRFKDSVDRFDAAAAAALGVNRTDLRCLTILNDRGPLPASRLADALGLTRGATTTALDRLERAGYARRTAHAEDGRSVLVTLTETGQTRIAAIWHPLRERGKRHLAGYSADELALVARFLGRSAELHERSMAPFEPALAATGRP